jgi:hypothetical protein
MLHSEARIQKYHHLFSRDVKELLAGRVVHHGLCLVRSGSGAKNLWACPT